MKKLTIVGPAAVIAVGGFLFYASHGQAQSPTDPQQLAKIQVGLQIAPVPLNMTGKDSNLVGWGSYLVNAVGDCNGCHTAGGPPNFNYASGGNPYFGQHPKKVDPAVYLGGGQDFGPVGDPTTYPGPDIVARNITPDASGLPEGGHTYAEFVQIIRTGIDFDHAHPTCTSVSPKPTPANCIPAPAVGELLQIMPWPVFADMTDYDLQAIYTYLSAIPCVEGGPGEPANRCGKTGAKTAAVAGPKSVTVTASAIQLDGTKSTSADGKPLTYFWTIPQGSPSTAISGGNTATPTVTFPRTRGAFTFQLTVTDSTGKTATDTATVNFLGN